MKPKGKISFGNFCSKSTKKEASTLWKLPVVFVLDFGQLFEMCLGKQQICDDAFLRKHF